MIIRKVFGVAGAAHMNASRYHYRFAWPSGDWGSLPVEGGIEAAYKSDLEKSNTPELLIKQIEEKALNKLGITGKGLRKFLEKNESAY